MMYAAPLFILGLVFRRFWGGWETAGSTEWHYIKIVIGFALGVAACIVVTLNASAAFVFGLLFTCILLNPWHSNGQRMGKGGPSLPVAILYMSGSYGVLTSTAALATFAISHQPSVLYYAPVGWLASVGYLLGWYVLPPLFGGLTATGGYARPVVWGKPFIDGPTAIGECVLGGLLLGGVALMGL